MKYRVSGDLQSRVMRFLALVWWDKVNGLGIRGHYKSLVESQYFSSEALQELQLKKLQKLLQEASRHVPYYREMFSRLGIQAKDIGSLSDLSKLPLLTKQLIREFGKNMINSRYSPSDLVQNSTSGSTGEVTRFFSDRRSYPFYLALHMRQHDWMNIDYFVRQIWIWGASFSAPQKKSKGLLSGMKRKRTISSYHLSPADSEEIIGQINSYKPCLIGAYPSHLCQIARTANTPLTHFPTAISLSGEMTYPEQLAAIQAYYQAPVFNYYGARDGSLIAQECDKHSGLHLFSENVIVEILDDNDNPVSEGIGRVVLTLLHNYAMPLIRYEIGDLAEVDEQMWEPCSCGRTLPRLKRIIGRTLDIVVFPNGNRVGGTFWTHLLRSDQGVTNFNVSQDKNGALLIKYTTLDNAGIDTEPLKAKIVEYGGNATEVAFQKVDVLDNHTKTGKLKLVSSEYSK